VLTAGRTVAGRLIQPQPVAAPVTVALRLRVPMNEVTVVGKPPVRHR